MIERDTIESLSAKLIPLIPFEDLPLKTLNFFDSNHRWASRRGNRCRWILAAPFLLQTRSRVNSDLKCGATIWLSSKMKALTCVPAFSKSPEQWKTYSSKCRRFCKWETGWNAAGAETYPISLAFLYETESTVALSWQFLSNRSFWGVCQPFAVLIIPLPNWVDTVIRSGIVKSWWCWITLWWSTCHNKHNYASYKKQLPGRNPQKNVLRLWTVSKLSLSSVQHQTCRSKQQYCH